MQYKHILLNELRLVSRSSRSMALYFIYIAVLVAATVGSSINVSNTHSIVADSIQDDHARWASIERVLSGTPAEGDPSVGPLYNVYNAYTVGAWLGQRHAVKKPVTFSGIAVGQGDLFPATIQVSLLGNAVDEASITVSNPNHRFFGGFDPAFVVVFLFPIVIIGLCFDAFSQERESKRIAFYNAISGAPAALLLGRLATRSGIAVILTLIATTLAPLLLFHKTDGWFFDASVWGGTVLIWGVIWTGIVGLLAIPRVSPGISFFLALMVWLGFVMIGPAIIDHHVSGKLPPPDRVRFALETRALKQRLLEDPNAHIEDYYREYPNDRPSAERIESVNTPKPGGAVTSDERRFLMTSYPLEKRIAPQRAIFRTQSIEREVYTQTAGRWIPGLAVYMIAEEISHNSRSAIEDFHRQADQFQQQWRYYFVPRTMRIEPFTQKDISRVPEFQYSQENSTLRQQRIMGLLIPLAVFALLLAIALKLATRRLI